MVLLDAQVTELLGIDCGMRSEFLSAGYCSSPSPSAADAEIKPEVHKLIHDLLLHIHKTEPDIEKSILVFLPTYSALEQQWYLLEPLSSSFKVHILHSSIDTEQALMAMNIWKSHRKVYISSFLENCIRMFVFCGWGMEGEKFIWMHVWMDGILLIGNFFYSWKYRGWFTCDSCALDSWYHSFLVSLD